MISNTVQKPENTKIDFITPRFEGSNSSQGNVSGRKMLENSSQAEVDPLAKGTKTNDIPEQTDEIGTHRSPTKHNSSMFILGSNANSPMR